jgi:hypothetical protein
MPRRPLKCFLGNPRSVSLGILLVMLLWGMTAVAPGAELDSVVVMAIDPEAGHLLLAKLGIAKYMIPLKVEPGTHVVNSSGKPLALSDIRVGAQGTIRYTRSPSGEYTVESLVLE